MMNTTGDTNRIADVSYAGSGNSGSADLTIPQVLKTKKHVGTIDRATKWWEKGVSLSTVPVNFFDKPMVIAGQLFDWRMYDDEDLVCGGLHWLTSGPNQIVLVAPKLDWKPTVVLWHELGHLFTMDKETVEALLYRHTYYRVFLQEKAELDAWRWARKMLGEDWDDEANDLARRSLATYGVYGEII